MARLKGAVEVLEARRHRALRLLDERRSLNEVGRLLGCAPSSFLQWQDARARGGKKALKVRASPGRSATLGSARRPPLVKSLLRGALAHGCATDLRTTARIAEVIEMKFGITFHRGHLFRLMEQLGWSDQRPERRAVERSEDRIEYWHRTDWPTARKGPQGWVPRSLSSTNRAFS